MGNLNDFEFDSDSLELGKTESENFNDFEFNVEPVELEETVMIDDYDNFISAPEPCAYRKIFYILLVCLVVGVFGFLFVISPAKTGNTKSTIFFLRGNEVERLQITALVVLDNRVVGEVERLESGVAQIIITDGTVNIPSDSRFTVTSDGHWFQGKSVVTITSGRSSKAIQSGATYYLASSTLPQIPWFLIAGGGVLILAVVVVAYLVKILLKPAIVLLIGLLILGLIFVVLKDVFPEWLSCVLATERRMGNMAIVTSDIPAMRGMGVRNVGVRHDVAIYARWRINHVRRRAGDVSQEQPHPAKATQQDQRGNAKSRSDKAQLQNHSGEGE